MKWVARKVSLVVFLGQMGSLCATWEVVQTLKARLADKEIALKAVQSQINKFIETSVLNQKNQATLAALKKRGAELLEDINNLKKEIASAEQTHDRGGRRN